MRMVPAVHSGKDRHWMSKGGFKLLKKSSLLITLSILILFGVIVANYKSDRKDITYEEKSNKVLSHEENVNLNESENKSREEKDITKDIENKELKTENMAETDGKIAISQVTEQQGQKQEVQPVQKNNQQESKYQKSGLSFSSKEEAIQFGMSRFTKEEIAIFNQAAAKGLTPEQKSKAIKIAYSRFTADEIAAIEKALGK